MQGPIFEEHSTLVTGLEVLWNEEDGTPDRIFFGCRGKESAGRLGSVDRDGTNLREMMKGAYSGDVVLLPRELDPITIAPTTSFVYNSNAVTSPSTSPTNLSSNSLWQDFFAFRERFSLRVALPLMPFIERSTHLCQRNIQLDTERQATAITLRIDKNPQIPTWNYQQSVPPMHLIQSMTKQYKCLVNQSRKLLFFELEWPDTVRKV
eukprot:jgi/Psemu1/310949/fgenesh1_kg.699_\